jgi:hypothetical protein
VTPGAIERDEEVIAARFRRKFGIADGMAKTADAAHEFSPRAALPDGGLVFFG